MNTITHIDEYEQAIRDTLTSWLQVHTDPETWANEWCLDEPVTEYLTHLQAQLAPGSYAERYYRREGRTLGDIGNNYFTCNVIQEALTLWAEDFAPNFARCQECSTLLEPGEDCGCDDPDFDEVEPEELAEFMAEVYYYDEPLELALIIGDNYLWQAMVEKCFPIYREALRSLVDPVVTEVEDILEQLNNAQDEAERLAALTWANHCQHVNGSIVDDYGPPELSELVDAISQEGIENVLDFD